ncbi:caspase-14-like isoform X2 [Scyliorhinus torazame]|uniref:caspase-14-like isoform X2 n=1 Tax=Scyliorhinus torazame TaxID=75743 RepID=UPI003B59AB4E
MASSGKDAGDSEEASLHKDRYDMSGDRHAFVLCVRKNRRGAQHDLDKVKGLLKEFNFVDRKPCLDRTNEEIIWEVEQFRNWINASSNVSCVFIFIMAHGEEGTIFGTDGGEGVKLDMIFSMFDNKNCPQLQLKPKVFVIQACRGKSEDSGVKMADGFRSLDLGNVEETAQVMLPIMTDTFTIYPAQPGFVAYRYSDKGSVMILKMDEVFRAFRSQLHLYDLFVKVNQRVTEDDIMKSGSTRKTTLVMESTLTKALYID